jgi:D-lyxose ketol-isomerase
MKDVKKIRKRALAFLKKTKIAVTRQEATNIEVADFGLNDVNTIGLELITYINNDRYCGKELILFPRQTCPEHSHPPIDERNIGKMETFRCRSGIVYLYVEGEPVKKAKAKIPTVYKPYFTAWKEIVLKPGDQYTIPPNTLHWFQGGDKGAIVSEFSSTSIDESDIFTDPNIKRMPVYE